MQMLYQSDSYVVVQIEVPSGPPGTPLAGVPAPPLRAGYEIVDKAARKEVYIEGALAERFTRGVQALVAQGADSPEAFDDYIAGFAGLAQQPLAVH